MSERKLSEIEVETEQVAKVLTESAVTPMPVETMRAISHMRRLSQRVANLENALALEQRQHRDTERRLKETKTERDIARRERDERINA